MAAWSISGLRIAYPEAQIHWAIQERCASVVDTNHLVHSVVLGDMNAWKTKRWSPVTWKSQLAVFSRLREVRFDVGLDFQGHSKTALCLRLSGAKQRFASRGTDGFARRLNHLVNCGVGKNHEVEVAMNLVKYSYPNANLPALPFMPETIGESFDISIQMGAGHPDKKVDTQVWKTVAQELSRIGKSVAIIGAPNDPHFEMTGVKNLVGKLDLLGSMGIVKNSKVHLASDTGTGHISSAYGVKTVSVFGPTDPAIYRPWGENAIVLRSSENPNSINASDIVEAVLMQLKSIE